MTSPTVPTVRKSIADAIAAQHRVQAAAKAAAAPNPPTPVTPGAAAPKPGA